MSAAKHGTASLAEPAPVPARVQTIAVDADEAGMRVDRFVEARFPGLSFSHIQRIIRKGELRVNGKRVQEATLRLGDEVAIAQVIFRLEDLAPVAAPAAPAHARPAQLSGSTDLPLPVDDSELIPLDDELILDD